MKDANLDVVNDDQQTLIKKDPVKKEDDEYLSSYLCLFQTCIMEGMAYFFIILFIYFSAGDQTKFIFAFWSIFVIFGNVSGAHVNPIVTFGLWIYQGNMFQVKNIVKMFSYIIFQFLGGALAACFSYNAYKKKVVYVKHAMDETPGKIALCEAFFSGTFVFVCMFISCAATRPSEKNYINLTLLSVWLYLIIGAGSEISGGCYNPTVYMVLNGLAYFSGKDTQALRLWKEYVLAPLAAAIVFVLLFKYVFRSFYASKNKIVISDDD
jgi:glycerol uptake facilitator-like aquaporin